MPGDGQTRAVKGSTKKNQTIFTCTRYSQFAKTFSVLFVYFGAGAMRLLLNTGNSTITQIA